MKLIFRLLDNDLNKDMVTLSDVNGLTYGMTHIDMFSVAPELLALLTDCGELAVEIDCTDQGELLEEGE